MQERVRKEVETEVRNGTQFVGKEISPFIPSIQQIVEDDKVIDMGGTVLGGKP
jgi:hypothetical protein